MTQEKQTNTQPHPASKSPCRIAHDNPLGPITVTKMKHRTSAGGAWVDGLIAGHRFQALVFPAHALYREWEVNGDSRISKLWLQRIDDSSTVFNWDRGLDIEPQSTDAALIVQFMAKELADFIWF